jgi:hypothetical protein
VNAATRRRGDQKTAMTSLITLTPLKITALMAIAATFCSANTAYGAPVDGTLPDNAIARNYGRGWNCAKGFRRQVNQCVIIKRPKHSYFTGSSFGSGWDCRHGYYVDGDRCTAIKVPENAYLNGSRYSDGWQCNRGYRKSEGACAQIIVPSNAYLTDSSYGSGWDCERGYRPNFKQLRTDRRARQCLSGHARIWSWLEM